MTWVEACNYEKGEKGTGWFLLTDNYPWLERRNLFYDARPSVLDGT